MLLETYQTKYGVFSIPPAQQFHFYVRFQQTCKPYVPHISPVIFYIVYHTSPSRLSSIRILNFHLVFPLVISSYNIQHVSLIFSCPADHVPDRQLHKFQKHNNNAIILVINPSIFTAYHLFVTNQHVASTEVSLFSFFCFCLFIHHTNSSLLLLPAVHITSIRSTYYVDLP